MKGLDRDRGDRAASLPAAGAGVAGWPRRWRGAPGQRTANDMMPLVEARRESQRGGRLAMRWDQLDLWPRGVQTAPDGHDETEGRAGRVPLTAAVSASAGQALDWTSEWVFPGTGESGHREAIKAGVAGRPQGRGACRAGWRAPDRQESRYFRHTFASILASSGLSLPMSSARCSPGVLGRRRRQRYAHLLDNPLRAATERVGALFTGGDTAEHVVPISGSSR